MKKVLIITYHYKKQESIGSIRLRGLTKYLPKYDWEPVILTSKHPTKIDSNYKIIEIPCKDIYKKWKKRLGFKNDNITVKDQLELPSYKNKKTLFDYLLNLWEDFFTYPDPQKDWYKSAVKTAYNLFKEEKFDAIISSSSPVTSHLIAKELKNKYNTPWIADLRDLWTQNHYYSHNSIRTFMEKKLELKTLSKADALITISSPLADKLKLLHKKIPYVITNGFNPEQLTKSNGDLTNKFTITYAGSLYQGKRDPYKLFKAVQDLILNNIINPKDLEIRFYGPKEDWLNKEINDLGLQNEIKWFGTINRAISLEKQKESHILLLLLWDHPEEYGVYTGKLFEYLAAQRPILCIGGSKGVVKDLLNDTNAGIFTKSTDEIKNAISNYYKEYKEKGSVNYQGIKSKINKYSHKEMTGKFIKVLNQVTNN